MCSLSLLWALRERLGKRLKGDEELQITPDAVSEGGVILVFHSKEGAEVVMEDINSAITKSAPPASKDSL